MYRLLLADIFADKLAGETRMRASTLDWTIAYPVLLTNGPVTGRYRAAEHLALQGLPKISRADVAHFMLAEAQNRVFVRKIVALSY
jgi:putative NADH-flavin reductase